MTPRPDETPAEIAARYGCDPRTAPPIRRIPRGVSAFAPGEAGPNWIELRNAKLRAMNRAARLREAAALAARIQAQRDKAAKKEAQRVERNRLRREKHARAKAEAIAAREARAAKAKEAKAAARQRRLDRAAAQAERENQWLALVRDGMSWAGAAVQIGMSKRSGSFLADRWIERGVEVPLNTPTARMWRGAQ